MERNCCVKTRRRLATVLVATCGMVLMGCGAGEPERHPVVAVGVAPSPSSPVALASPDGTGLLPLNSWPRACDLLTETDVRAVLPQTTKVESKLGDLTFKNADLHARERSLDVTNVRCTHTVWLPGTYPAELPATYLNLTVRAAGTPKLARLNYDKYVKEHGDTACPTEFDPLGLDACHHNALHDRWVILKNGVAIEFTANVPTLDGRFAGQGADEQVRDFWHRQVTPRFVTAIVTKLP